MNQVIKIIYGLAALVVTSTTLTVSPKSVNVELETSLLFEPKDSHQHLKFLHSLRKVLDRLEQALQPQNLRANDAHKKPLKTFVTNVIKTISKYHPSDLQRFFTSLDSEMNDHFYKGSVFREIVYDPKLQTYIRNKLKEFAIADGAAMESKLRKYSSDAEKNCTLNRIWTLLNDSLNAESELKMKGILNKLQDPMNVQSTVKEALDLLIFELYDRLNYTSRARLADEISKISQDLETNRVDKDLKLTFRRSSDVESKEAIYWDQEESKDIHSKESLVLDKDIEIFVKPFHAREHDIDGEDLNILNDQKNDISSDNKDFINNLKNSA